MRLRVESFDATVGMGALVDLVDVSGKAGLLSSVNMRVASGSACSPTNLLSGRDPRGAAGTFFSDFCQYLVNFLGSEV